MGDKNRMTYEMANAKAAELRKKFAECRALAKDLVEAGALVTIIRLDDYVTVDDSLTIQIKRTEDLGVVYSG